MSFVIIGTSDKLSDKLSLLLLFTIISIPKEVQAFISATTMHYTKPETSWICSMQSGNLAQSADCTVQSADCMVAMQSADCMPCNLQTARPPFQ